jgi:hypothetical protein
VRGADAAFGYKWNSSFAVDDTLLYPSADVRLFRSNYLIS